MTSEQHQYVPHDVYTSSPCQQFPTDLSFKPSYTSPSLPQTKHNRGRDCTEESLYSKLLKAPPSEDSMKSDLDSTQPRKRPSDFSAEFLLSHQPAHTKRPRSAEDLFPVGNDVSAAHARSPLIPSPSAFGSGVLPFPCTPWLEGHHLPPSAFTLSSSSSSGMVPSHQAGLMRSFHGMSRERSTSVTSTSSLEAPSPVGHRDFSRAMLPSPERLTDEAPSAFRSRPRHDTGLLIAASAASPPLLSGDRSPDDLRSVMSERSSAIMASHKETALTSPYDLLVPRSGEMRRGTSTSPAHSERTSSGCGSPSQPDSPSHSPTHIYPLSIDAGAWNGATTASSSSLRSPSSQSSLPYLPPLGLRYLPPGLPYPPTLPKGLSLPLPYSSKALADSVAASTFSSSSRSQPSFLHPTAAAAAAAAYYNSLRSSLPLPPLPFSFPGAGSAELKTSPRRVETDAKESDLLRQRMHNTPSPYDAQSSAFQPLGVSPSYPRGVSPASAGLSPRHRPSPTSLSPLAMTSPAAGVAISVDLAPRLGLAGNAVGIGGVGSGERGLAVAKCRSREQQEAVRYNCDDCSKSYSTHSGLSKHRQFHCTAQVKKEFSCKYCEKSYTSLGALKMHIRTHTLPCKCTVCGKAFSRPWLLQGHVRTHTGEKPFSCQHCSRAFADRSNLRAHLQTHSHVKKYSCQHCHKTFSRMSLLTKHEDQCRVTTIVAATR